MNYYDNLSLIRLLRFVSIFCLSFALLVASRRSRASRHRPNRDMKGAKCEHSAQRPGDLVKKPHLCALFRMYTSVIKCEFLCSFLRLVIVVPSSAFFFRRVVSLYLDQRTHNNFHPEKELMWRSIVLSFKLSNLMSSTQRAVLVCHLSRSGCNDYHSQNISILTKSNLDRQSSGVSDPSSSSSSSPWSPWLKTQSIVRISERYRMIV
jgi:hypothetical protein